jgi:predicted transposase/invertase (TIGR01784 family)
MNQLTNKAYYPFSDDRMFCTVMSENPELLRKTLELLLDTKIRKIVSTSSQKVWNYHKDVMSVRFDVFLEDGSRAYYDLEMETTKDGTKLKLLPKRARMYSSLSDSTRQPTGTKYEDIGKTYITFICLHDPFGYGLAKYTGIPQCKETHEADADVDNGVMCVYFNANAKQWNVNKEVEAFLKYVAGVEHEDIELTVQIEEAVKRYNENEDWRQWAMTFGDRLEEAREEARAEGKAEGKAEGREEGKAEERREGRKRFQTETIRRMIRLGYNDKAIQAAVGVADVNEIKKLRKMIMN